MSLHDIPCRFASFVLSVKVELTIRHPTAKFLYVLCRVRSPLLVRCHYMTFPALISYNYQHESLQILSFVPSVTVELTCTEMLLLKVSLKVLINRICYMYLSTHCQCIYTWLGVRRNITFRWKLRKGFWWWHFVQLWQGTNWPYLK